MIYIHITYILGIYLIHYTDIWYIYIHYIHILMVNLWQSTKSNNILLVGWWFSIARNWRSQPESAIWFWTYPMFRPPQYCIYTIKHIYTIRLFKNHANTYIYIYVYICKYIYIYTHIQGWTCVHEGKHVTFGIDRTND